MALFFLGNHFDIYLQLTLGVVSLCNVNTLYCRICDFGREWMQTAIDANLGAIKAKIIGGYGILEFKSCCAAISAGEVLKDAGHIVFIP